MTLKHLILSISALSLCACASTTQYTSGQDYLARYDNSAVLSASSSGSIESDIRTIAAIEPDLQFPARIGLARIERGNLISIPQDESEAWATLHRRLGPSFGEFVPVSPLIASMVSKVEKGTPKARAVVDNVRRGSARQHLDYVLIYEVSDTTDSNRNALQIADLSILGLFVLPSRNMKVDSTATAMLIDVRNGYPYGTATAFAERKAVTTVVGSSGRKAKLKDKARVIAVENLTSDVEDFMFELRDIATEKFAEY
ncbi:hypothetical protein N9W89_00590 [Hellea sp.]|nr:hypothetical protein [Hellea sp.]